MKFITNELNTIFLSCYTGHDVAPARVHRLEGYMKALMDNDLCSELELKQLIAARYYHVYHENMPELFPPTRDGIISLPVVMLRAPV